MALPGVESSLGVSPPAFVRKLTRKSHWGIAGDPLDERLANRRHCHISASTNQLRHLCELAMTAGRSAASLTTATMRDVVKAAEEDRCHIVTADSAVECACQRS